MGALATTMFQHPHDVEDEQHVQPEPTAAVSIDAHLLVLHSADKSRVARVCRQHGVQVDIGVLSQEEREPGLFGNMLPGVDNYIVYLPAANECLDISTHFRSLLHQVCLGLDKDERVLVYSDDSSRLATVGMLYLMAQGSRLEAAAGYWRDTLGLPLPDGDGLTSLRGIDVGTGRDPRTQHNGATRRATGELIKSGRLFELLPQERPCSHARDEEVEKWKRTEARKRQELLGIVCETDP